MECGDSSPLFGEGFSLHNLAVGPDGTEPSNPFLGLTPSTACNGGTRSTASRETHETGLTGRGHPILQSTQRRAPLVRSAFSTWMSHRLSPGTTSVPLRLVFPEGPACRVRLSPVDDTPRFPGHCKRSPVGAIHELPLPEARSAMVDWCTGARGHAYHAERIAERDL